MAREWDKQNMRTLAVNLKKEEAEAFQKLAQDSDTTVAALLRGYVRGTLSAAEPMQGQNNNAPWGMEHTVSYKNVDRLKHEVSFHNPDDLNPNQMLNLILDRYFAFLDMARK